MDMGRKEIPKWLYILVIAFIIIGTIIGMISFNIENKPKELEVKTDSDEILLDYDDSILDSYESDSVLIETKLQYELDNGNMTMDELAKAYIDLSKTSITYNQINNTSFDFNNQELIGLYGEDKFNRIKNSDIMTEVIIDISWDNKDVGDFINYCCAVIDKDVFEASTYVRDNGITFKLYVPAEKGDFDIYYGSHMSVIKLEE